MLCHRNHVQTDQCAHAYLDEVERGDNDQGDHWEERREDGCIHLVVQRQSRGQEGGELRCCESREGRKVPIEAELEDEAVGSCCSRSFDGSGEEEE